jgi:O-antigen ligase
VLVGAIHVLAPGSIGTVLDPSLWFKSSSSAHRSNDLPSIWPDIITHPIFGLGSGSANPDQPDQYRILDDEMLGILWEMGVAGLLAFIAMILAPIFDARKARRSRDRELAQIAIAASAGCVAFFVVSFLFDSLSFSETPYLFFILAGFCVIASGAVADEPPPVVVETPPRRMAVTV